MNSVGEFFSTGADRMWHWFITMSAWEYVAFAAFILLSVYLAFKVFRSSPEDLAEEPVEGPYNEIIIPDLEDE